MVSRTDLLRPFAWTWVGTVRSELDGLPHPTDEPRQRAVGPDPDHVLILGNGAAIGFGVSSFRLALPGQLARALAARTCRGAVVDVAARRGTTVDRARNQVRELDLPQYDGVVLTLGASDALKLLAPHAWRAGLTALLDDVRALIDPASLLVVLGIPPVQRSPHSSGLLGNVIDTHALALNDVTADVCGESGTLYVAPDRTYRAEVGAAGAARHHQRLADTIAAAAAPRLTELAAKRGAGLPRSHRHVADVEVERQAALDALHLHRGANARIDHLTRMARETFGTRYAAVTLIDGDRHWNKSSVNLPNRDIPRSMSLCALTIQQDDALVIEDLAHDARTPQGVVDLGLRFYAGLAIESSDGYRIGALCLLDDRPHPREIVDVALLQEFALRVQRELWHEAAEHAELVSAASSTHRATRETGWRTRTDAAPKPAT